MVGGTTGGFGLAAVGLVAGLSLLGLLTSLWKGRLFARVAATFAALSPLRKLGFVLVVVLGTWWGGAKEGRPPASAPRRNPSSEQSGEVDAPATNAPTVTAFSVDGAGRTAAFSVAWPDGLFAELPSRGLHLLFSTNLVSDVWTPLGVVSLPQGTNAHAFAVSSNDVPPSARDAFLASFGGSGFYRLAVDADADGDGLADCVERYSLHTDPDRADTDDDGLGDGYEVALGTDPAAADTDGDGLDDREETGRLLSATPSGTWLTLPEDAVDLTPRFPRPYNSTVEYALEHPVRLNGESFARVVVGVNGAIYLPRAGCTNGFYSGGLANLSRALCPDAVVLAPYVSYLYLTPNAPASRVSVGEAVWDSKPVFVVQYENVCPDYNISRDFTTNSLSFQAVIPLDASGIVHFLYRDIVGDDMGGWDATVGIQSLGARWAHVYLPFLPDSIYPNGAFSGEDPPTRTFFWRGELYNGLDLAFDLGTGTSPRLADTDGDGLNDGAERQLGTSGLLADTDGDGFSDAEEVVLDIDPTDPADDLPARWVSVTGDLEMGEAKTLTETVVLPAGTAAFLGVFIASREYPTFTDQSSPYNDRISWLVHQGDRRLMDGFTEVNNEDGAWDAAAANGQSLFNLSPVVLKDKAFVIAQSDADTIVTVNLAAMNVRDGAFPSTVTVGIFPLKVVQANRPTGVGGGGTSAAALPTSRVRIPPNGIAYITAAAKAPRLTAQFKGLPSWIPATWSGSLTSERSERHTVDNRTLAGGTGGEAYDVTAALNGETVGGRCGLNVSVGGTSTNYVFFIRGKNPLDAVAKDYITAHVDAEFRDYAWMIAKHESRDAGRVYNQFNAAGALKELPNLGADNGWGIAQIDKGENGDTTAELYDWHENVASMNAKLRSSLRTYERFVGYYRDLYANNPAAHWREPDGEEIMIDNYWVSAKVWSVLTLYNGAQGCPERFLDGMTRRVPIEFIPATSTWVLHKNVKDYVRRVIPDRNQPEVE